MTTPEFFSDHDAALALFGGLSFGFLNSLHCVFMCGPLVAACGSGGGGLASGVGYHAGRGVSYTVTGIVAGALGGSLGVESMTPSQPVFAFVLAATFVFAAFGVGSRFARVAGSGRFTRRVFGLLQSLPPVSRGASLGLVTPLLPCGLLYAAIALAAAAGSAVHGGLVMLGFAGGIVPALALAQWRFGALQARFGSTRAGVWTWRIVAAVAAAALVWRGVAGLVSGGEACCNCGGGAV